MFHSPTRSRGPAPRTLCTTPGMRSSAGATSFNWLIGWFLYPAGDLLGQSILGHVNVYRLIAIALIGGLLYRLEVPAWFRFLDHFRIWRPDSALLRPFLCSTERPARLNWLGRTIGAMLYFNPLWVARHLMVIMLATTSLPELNASTALAAALSMGLKSFLTNLPLSVLGNYLVQQQVPLKYRFLASATLSGIFAAVYAIEFRLLH